MRRAPNGLRKTSKRKTDHPCNENYTQNKKSRLFPCTCQKKAVPLQPEMKSRFHILLIGIAVLMTMALLFSACNNTPEDPSANISFSVDTLTFDTVFTSKGTVTKTVMIRNLNKQPVVIDKVAQADGSSFFINIDGEDSIPLLRNIEIPAGDSLYLFVCAFIDPQNSNSPVLVSDQIKFFLKNGNSRVLQLEAYGQDVILIDSLYISSDYTFVADKPYLVRYWIASDPQVKVTINPGATFYMHKDASIFFYGSLEASGTVGEPITFQGDRLDDYITNIPYVYVPGQWAGVYLYDYEGLAPNWKLQHLSILSAINGLFCSGKSYTHRPQLELQSARIHNMDQYGLVLQNTDAQVANCEISNCASYCIYLAGGNADFFHNTVASYYRHTAYNSNVGLYDTPRDDVAAVYINNISKTFETLVSFYNNIITGVRDNQLVIASPFPDLYTGFFKGNYLKTDTLRIPNASANVYAQDSDVVFRNDYYADYKYFDFRLDSLSPARGIADSIVAQNFPIDLFGNARTTFDAGCYVYTDYSEEEQDQP